MKQKTRRKRRQLKETNKMTMKQVLYKGPGLKGDTPDEYGLFVPQFDQFCQDNDIYGYVQANKHVSLPETELEDITGLTQVEQKKIEAAFKKNKEAVGMYTHAVQSLALMNIVSRTKTKDWPSGQAWEIRKTLDESITPKELPSRVKMLSELSQVELKPEEHPKILFEKISAIQCKYAQEYSTADAIATILKAAPHDCNCSH
jgi:hypothetical protein